MAKNALGRGLGSLLGGSYEDTRMAQPAPTRSAEQPAAVSKAVSNVSQPERITVNAHMGEVTTRPATRTVPETPTPDMTDSVVTEQNVTVKSVSTRKPEEMDIDKIHPNENQPRINFKKEELEELAESIRKDGLLQPILVRPKDDAYEIIAGERRYRACKLLGLTSVPIRIKEADDEETLELALVENIQRSDLNPIEEAYGYRRLMEKKNLTQAEVAQMVSKGRSTIANALRLLDLPEDAQQLLYEEKITAGHARAILSIPTAEGRQKLTEKLVNEKLSVREAESFARLLTMNASPKPAEPKNPMPKSYKKVARTLRDRLGTNVKVKTSQGRNRIEIEFKDEEDLQRMFAAMFNEKQEEKSAE